jgi:hypothetical protein
VQPPPYHTSTLCFSLLCSSTVVVVTSNGMFCFLRIHQSIMLDIYGIGALSSTEKTGNSIVPLSNTNLSLVSTKCDR